MDTDIAGTTVLRALAHPLRMALLDAVRTHGPATATELARIVDDTPSNCSFHLRTLATAGLIEQAASDDQRRRPWRSTGRRLVLEPGSTSEQRQAFDAAMAVVNASAEAALHQWLRIADSAPQQWRDAAFNSLLNTRMTADELAAVSEKLTAVLSPYLDDPARREPDPTGERQPVRLQFYGFPLTTPATTQQNS